ncbi:type VI secretion system-associated protein TagF [Ruegeria aquimaris]|uniref:type VI secretion system-associated protein TagF n=1 Tax=Ruegeria aquimaris TaxID=2984333 RepID=UPI0038503BC7
MTGFFGKLPSHGDFVVRGLGQGVRGYLDRWLSQGLALVLRDGAPWPHRGVRGLLQSPAGPLAILVLPSRDTPGRVFPLTACVMGVSDRQGVDEWADQVFPLLSQAASNGADLEHLATSLGAIRLPDSAVPLQPPLLWCDERAPGHPDGYFSAH